MELSSSGSFFKFDAVGSKITGRFVSVDLAKESPWGPKVEMTLDVEGKGNVRVSCPTSLANTIKENLAMLQADKPVLTLTFSGTVPSKKGNPAKLIRVETVEPF